MYKKSPWSKVLSNMANIPSTLRKNSIQKITTEVFLKGISVELDI